MKVRCPRCRQPITVADNLAGKAIRCPSCNRAFALPKPNALVTAEQDVGPDLEGLAKLESGSQLLSQQEVADVQAAEAAGDAKSKPIVRVCPHCRSEVRTADLYAETPCPNCSQSIPALVPGGRAKIALVKALARGPRGEGPGAFYAELVTCLTYPLPALGSVFAAGIVAVAAALLPVAVIIGGVQTMHQSTVGTAEEATKSDLSGAAVVLTAVFAAEVLVFAAIAVHLFLDVVRTTSIRNDRPPSLAWSPSKWGQSLFICVILAAYYVLTGYLVATITVQGDVVQMAVAGRFKEILTAGGANLILGLAVISSAIPMSLIGISLSSAWQGLNPVKIAQSIARTHAHYAFLLLLLLVYGIMFAAAFAAILFDWFLPRFDKMVKGSAEGDLAQVAFSLLAWGCVMAFFFYGTYVLARLHGVFARSFRKQLAFG